MNRPRIAVTLGDPGGIGPEVTLKALADPGLSREADYRLFASARILDRAVREAGLPALPADITLVDLDVPSWGDLPTGRVDAGNGRASFVYFERAVQEAEVGSLDAVVTGPIAKSAWDRAGIPWAGHTDYLAGLHPDAVMSFFSEQLKIVLYSHHISLREALARIRKDRLLEFFLRIHRLLISRGRGYRYLVAGMNPHAGEQGMMGREEIEEIAPAVEAARKAGMSVSGPYPPDTICRMAYGQSDTVVISLYHDQGLIAFKLVSFENGVNVTLGLPFIRTSPDHGTAFEIAGKGKADPASMIAALRLAHQLSLGVRLA